MTDIKVGQNTNFNRYQLMNAILHLVNGAPSTPSEGQVWYDTATDTIMFRNASQSIDVRDRASHGGTQVASTISDFNNAVRTGNTLNQLLAPTVDLSMATHKITGLVAGSASGQAVEYDQMNSAIAASVLANLTGLVWKEPARAATTVAGGNIATLAGGAPNTLDGVTLAANDRILVKNQSTAAQNGIYTVTTLGTGSNGTWTRAADANTAAELQGGVMISVDEGTVGAPAGVNTVWMITADITTLGTDAIAFTQFGVGGNTYTGSLGVQLVGSDFRANLGAGLTLSGNQIIPDFSAGQVMRRKTAVGTVGTTGVDITVLHNFALADKNDLIVKVYESGVGEVIVGVLPLDANNVVLSFGDIPITNQYRYSMIGLS